MSGDERPAAAPPGVRVRIDRVVLDGIGLPPEDRPRMRAALEGELARLLAEDGVPPGLAGGGATPRLRAAATVDANAGAAALGRQIARAVYGGIGG